MNISNKDIPPQSLQRFHHRRFREYYIVCLTTLQTLENEIFIKNKKNVKLYNIPARL
jgi:hypothetical protein